MLKDRSIFTELTGRYGLGRPREVTGTEAPWLGYGSSMNLPDRLGPGPEPDTLAAVPVFTVTPWPTVRRNTGRISHGEHSSSSSAVD